MTNCRIKPAVRQRGAALLLAMIVLTLVATLAAGMVYQQDRAIRVEAAERTREQTAHVARGALEIARWVLRQDATQSGKTDHLGEGWATALPETDLASLVSGQDRTPDGQEGQVHPFVRGQIIDAQSRFNLRNLFDGEGQLDLTQAAVFSSLCDLIGLPPEVPDRIVNGLRQAWSKVLVAEAPIAPSRLSQLTWLGIEPSVIQKLRPFVDLLPSRTTLNINTASAQVLAAATGLDTGSAERIVARRRELAKDGGFTSPAQLRELFAQLKEGVPANAGVTSSYFEVQAELRIGDEVTSDVWLLRREGTKVNVIGEERLGRWNNLR